MTSTETYIAFAAIMLVIALLAVAIDWFGKPLRHRRFIPKMYRFPDERIPRSAHVFPGGGDPRAFAPAASTSQAEALSQPPMPLASGGPPAGARGDAAASADWASPYPDGPNPGDKLGIVDLDRFDDLADDGVPLGEDLLIQDRFGTELDADDESAPDADAEAVFVQPTDDSPADRGIGWTLGRNVYNLTAAGEEPAPSTVRARYWRNLSATGGAAMFGANNRERLRAGKPPVRRNPRTGGTETMRLPTASYQDSDGRAPTPSWPGSELDPFAPHG